MFGGFALQANSLGPLEQIESCAPGHQVRFGSLNYTANIRSAKLASHAKESPIRTRDEVFNLVSS